MATIDTTRELLKILNRNTERTTLVYQKYEIEGFMEMLEMNFDIGNTFEKEFYFQGKKLCTVAHDEGDKFEGFEPPDTKSYNIVVTWPDGQKEVWKLSFFTLNGQIRKLGRLKFFREFFFTGQMLSTKRI